MWVFLSVIFSSARHHSTIHNPIADSNPETRETYFLDPNGCLARDVGKVFSRLTTDKDESGAVCRSASSCSKGLILIWVISYGHYD
jgi:hypothetical protein